MKAVKLAPSIVSADLSLLADQVRECEEAGAEYIHIDVMDGQFVPRITIGEPVVEAIRNVTDLTLDIHLMVADPERQAARYVDAGGDIINVHWEAAAHIHRILQEVQGRGKRAGVCINPGTHEGVLEQLLPELDQVMVMAVNPGASGQAFIEAVLPKVERLRRTIDDNSYRAEIEIDGGVKQGNASRCAAAGADVLVAASAIFNDDAGIAENIRGLREAVAALKA